MAVDMTPQPGDYSINLPVTFDYKGGRNANKKNQIIITVVSVLVTIILCVGIILNEEMELWQKIILPVGISYGVLFVLRYFIFKEQYFSDIFEKLKADDYTLSLDYIWQIFEIDYSYPYTCYFRNGYKGIFVRMEKDAITGKPDENMYDHYTAIGDAYNVAHSLNMNITHIDYMDNVGNDSRMQKLYDDLVLVENPDMQEMLIDIYANLQDEMSRNYSSFDIYLFLTRDNIANFVYNVQAVANKMLGGNFITYKVLDRYEIAKVCSALLNLHSFSIVEACENVLANNSHSGIIPISLTHPNGEVEIFNKTQEELRIIREENARKQQEAKEEALKRKRGSRVNNTSKQEVKVDSLSDSVDLFGDIQQSTSSNIDDSENLDLF